MGEPRGMGGVASFAGKQPCMEFADCIFDGLRRSIGGAVDWTEHDFPWVDRKLSQVYETGEAVRVASADRASHDASSRVAENSSGRMRAIRRATARLPGSSS